MTAALGHDVLHRPKRKDYDTMVQAVSGLMTLTGERGDWPVKPRQPGADLTLGL